MANVSVPSLSTIPDKDTGRSSILLVDDVPTNLLLLEKILQAPNVELVKAASGPEALEKLAHGDFAVAILDVQMPDMNGFELARAVRENPATAHTPIIFVTALNRDDRFVKEGYSIGAVDYLFKPVEPEILRSKVRVFCEVHRQRRLILQQMAEIEEKNAALHSEIAERKAMEEELEEAALRYRVLFELSPEAVAVQLDGAIAFTNAAMLSLLGTSNREDIIGHCMSEFVLPECRKEVEAHLDSVLRQGGQTDALETRIQRFDKREAHVSLRSACVVYGGTIGVQIALLDISERKQLEEELRRISLHDGVTRLPNRRCFDETLDREWKRAHRQHAPISLALADVDAFKQYNDHYGHQDGDACLQRVADALRLVAQRPADLAARYGGEEFALVLPETPVGGAPHVGERCRAAIEKLAIPHEKSPVASHVTMSVGVATMTPSRHTGPQTLIERADKALYKAKQSGRNRVCVYGRD